MTVEEAAEVNAGVQAHFGETQPFQDDNSADIHIERNAKKRLTYETVKLSKPLPFSITDERSFDEWLNDFEEYCEPSCGSDRRKWLTRTEGLLKEKPCETS